MPGGAGGHAGRSLLLWLGVAILGHALVALFGVLDRWLQVKPSPPLPALRLALLVSLLALVSAAIVDAAARVTGAVPRAGRLRRSDREQQFLRRQGSGKPAPPKCCRISAEGSTSCPQQADSGQVAEDSHLAAQADEASGQQADAGAAVGTAAAPGPSPFQQPSAPTWHRQDSTFVRRPGQPLPPRPELALQRGLSRRVRDLGEGRPQLVYWGALAVTTSLCNKWRHKPPGGGATITAECHEVELPSLEAGVVAAQDADVFIGMHGANMANSWLMRPGSSAIEISPYE
ncbi:expressed protein [Chlorella variabilis]|uniref:Expressed protein n=1 Tax=Chlorella variabilis TaxID=554065 RepID=E1ZU70_CHLVA|nr:expressed protein [Chlorella variabilis]EFN50625.1 expressed protein [Chlorella variabilis]|eukprot:XP_005842745.1 expressed protein [Chlorella variabilis]